MKITTNNIPRELVSWFDLPVSAQSDFDYISEYDKYSYRFVSYRGAWYDVYDTQLLTVNNGSPMGWAMVVNPDDPLSKWDSIISETFFSGVIFKLSNDENVICGRYSS